jgi:hypothetical protein
MAISFMINTSSPQPEYLDLTTFEEVDSGDDITVNQYSYDVVNMRRDEISTIRKDFGAGYFTDFEIEFDINWISGDAESFAGFFGLSQNHGTIQHMVNASSGLAIYIDRSSGTNKFTMQDFGTASNDTVVLGTGNHYFNVQRVGSTVTCNIYSDSNRTILEGTLTITTGTAYSYLHTLLSRNNASFGDRVITLSGSNYRIL